MKKIISAPKAPQAIGPYSQAVLAGGWLYCSGQIALNAATGEMLKGTVAEQTRLCLENLGAVLNEAGTDYGAVIKTTVYLKDMGAFAEMNAVYAEFFKDQPPARAAVEAAALPKGALVEIDAAAYLG